MPSTGTASLPTKLSAAKADRTKTQMLFFAIAQLPLIRSGIVCAGTPNFLLEKKHSKRKLSCLSMSGTYEHFFGNGSRRLYHRHRRRRSLQAPQSTTASLLTFTLQPHARPLSGKATKGRMKNNKAPGGKKFFTQRTVISPTLAPMAAQTAVQNSLPQEFSWISTEISEASETIYRLDDFPFLYSVQLQRSISFQLLWLYTPPRQSQIPAKSKRALS